MILRNPTAHDLALVRVVVFAIWLLELSASSLARIASLPFDAFHPHGPVRLLPEVLQRALLGADALTAVQATAFLACAWALTGLKGYRVAAMVAAVTLTFNEALGRGFAHINHSQVAPLYAVIVLAAFPADRVKIPRPGTRAPADADAARAIWLLTFGVFFAYTAIGVYRLTQSSPQIFFDDTMIWSIAKNTYRDSFYGMQLGKLVIEFPALAVFTKVGYFVVTIIEVVTFLIPYHRGLRLTWLLVIVGFHANTLILMNLWFWHNVILIFLLVAWADWEQARRDRAG